MVAESDLRKVVTGDGTGRGGTASAPLCPTCNSRAVAQYGDICHGCRPRED